MRRLRDALATLILVSGMLRFAIMQLPFVEATVPSARYEDGIEGLDSTRGEFDIEDSSGDHTGVILLPEHSNTRRWFRRCLRCRAPCSMPNIRTR